MMPAFCCNVSRLVGMPLSLSAPASFKKSLKPRGASCRGAERAREHGDDCAKAPTVANVEQHRWPGRMVLREQCGKQCFRSRCLLQLLWRVHLDLPDASFGAGKLFPQVARLICDFVDRHLRAADATPHTHKSMNCWRAQPPTAPKPGGVVRADCGARSPSSPGSSRQALSWYSASSRLGRRSRCRDSRASRLRTRSSG